MQRGLVASVHNISDDGENNGVKEGSFPGLKHVERGVKVVAVDPVIM